MTRPAPHEAARFVYGGVRFAISHDEPFDFVPTVAVSESSPSHASADVRVELASLPEIPSPISWTRAGARARIRTFGLEATTEQVSPTHFVVDVRISRTLPALARGLAETLATTLGELRGGTIFHTAAIVREERAILFVGRSGAGKSTAARLVPRALELAADRALVIEDDRGFVAYPLRLGTPSGLPLAPTRGYPLEAILGVRHDGAKLGIEQLSAIQALAVLRAATTTGGGAAEGNALLARLDALTRSVTVANVFTRLDSPLELGDLR